MNRCQVKGIPLYILQIYSEIPVRTAVFWDVMLCTLVHRFQHSDATCCTHLLSWIWTQQVINHLPHYKSPHPKICNSNIHCCENLKCTLPATVHLRHLKFVRHSLKSLLYYHHVYDFKHTKLFHIKSADTCLICQYTTTDKQRLHLPNLNKDFIQLFNRKLYYLQQFQNCTWNSINVPDKQFVYFLFWRLTDTINMKMQYISFMLTGWLFQNTTNIWTQIQSTVLEGKEEWWSRPHVAIFLFFQLWSKYLDFICKVQ